MSEDLDPTPAEGWIRISHPDVKDSVTDVSKQAYEEVWKDKGWRPYRPSKSETAKSDKE